MKFTKLLSILAVSLFVSTSCATKEPVIPSIDDLVAEGGVIVKKTDLIGDTGVTLISSDGEWINYFSVDGRKIIKMNNTGTTKVLAWRVNSNGQFCEQMFASESESCGNLVVIKNTADVYNNYNKFENKPGTPFTVIKGNFKNF